jgi:hypothetical protein
LGRKGFATDGEEHQGRLNYEDGIAAASAAFAEASNLRFAVTADPQTMILAEEAFAEQIWHIAPVPAVYAIASFRYGAETVALSRTISLMISAGVLRVAVETDRR